MWKKLFNGLVTVCILLTMGYYSYLDYKKREIYYIAVATKFEPNDTQGRFIVNGIKMQIDRYMQNNNVTDYDIKLKVFDDQVKTADANAKEIIKIPNLLGVIGHISSGDTFKGMSVYKDYNIPVITPSASHTDLANKFKNFFPVIFRNKEQGAFLPFYAKHILKAEKLIIIADDGVYAQDLCNATKDIAKKLNLEIDQYYVLSELQSKPEDIKNILNNLQLKDGAVVMLLLGSDKIGFDLINGIRKKSTNQVIFVGESVANTILAQKIMADDNIYGVTPHSHQLMNDEGYDFIKQYKKIYKEEPNWFATHAYDACKVLLDSLPDLNIKQPLDKIHTHIIKHISSKHEGITGRLDFTKQHYPTKDIYVASIRAGEWQPAPLQLMPVLDPNTVTKIEQEIADGYVILDNNAYYRIGNIVYAGCSLKSIDEINLQDNTCMLEFFMWFRNMPQNKNKGLVYLNAIKSTLLKTEYHGTKTDDTEVEVLTHTDKHLLYKIKQRVVLDSLALKEYEYLKYAHVVALTLRPELDPQQSIRLIADTATSKTFPRVGDKGWSVVDYDMYCDTLQETTFGNPRFEKDKSIDFSRLNVKVVVDRNHLLPPMHFAKKTGIWIVLVSALLLSLSFFMSEKAWGIRLGAWLTLNIAVQSVIIYVFKQQPEILFYKDYFVFFFDIISWLLVAYAVMLMIRERYFLKIEEETKMPVPHLLKMLIYTLITATTLSCIIAFVFNYTITGLITSGGFLVAIVGFAVQQNLSHIFSGLMLNIEKPFRIGDWVKVTKEGESLIGKVLDVTWRSTRILTINNNVIALPNSRIGESSIENYNYPDDGYVHSLEILLDRDLNPDEVMNVIRSSVKINDLVMSTDMQPKTITPDHVSYIVFIQTSDFEKSRLIVWGEVLAQIWHGLKAAGLHTVKVLHYTSEDAKPIK